MIKLTEPTPKVRLYMKAPKCLKCKVPLEQINDIVNYSMEKSGDGTSYPYMKNTNCFKCNKCFDLYQEDNDE